MKKQITGRPNLKNKIAARALQTYLFAYATKNPSYTWSRCCEVFRVRERIFYRHCLTELFINVPTKQKSYGDQYIKNILDNPMKSKKFLTDICNRGTKQINKQTGKKEHLGIMKIFAKPLNRRSLAARSKPLRNE